MEEHQGSSSSNSIHEGGSLSIKLKVIHGSMQLDITVPSQSTFGDLKRVIANETGLEPEVQNLLFSGKEKENQELLHIAGLKDNSEVVVMEKSDSSDKEIDLEEVKERAELSRGGEAVAEVREQIDELAEQVAALEVVVCNGTQVADKDFLFVTEMLMRQLLKLDGIQAEGEGRVQRKVEVRRVQSLVETMDNLKERNFNLNGSAEPVTDPGHPGNMSTDDQVGANLFAGKVMRTCNNVPSWINHWSCLDDLRHVGVLHREFLIHMNKEDCLRVLFKVKK